MKPKPKAGNKPSPHSIWHGLDKPGSSATVSKMMVFCDSALLSHHTTFEFHGGAPELALHKWPLSEVELGAETRSSIAANWHDYAMIARRVESPCSLIIGIERILLKIQQNIIL